MQRTFAGQLDALADWRRGIDRQTAELARFLGEHELLDTAAAQTLDTLRLRLGSERLVVAFVAEFSRGKSELINAIFFADTGRRILPATPGRTTMCPVELGFVPDTPPLLALLPIETRLHGLSLAELRERGELWTRLRLDPHDPARLAEALTEVMRTKAVSVNDARALGLWHDDAPDDNPSLIAEGLVEVPAWRHAVINYPHPLLRRGLVVLDTPGLNAIGTEPELTLSLLPSAHATVFILGADTGVTKSDLAIWRDHLDAQAMRYVVLNKIDTLADPLLTEARVQEQIDRQLERVAAELDVSPDHVFPLSARQALTARIDHDDTALASSGLPALESALTDELLPQRRQVLAHAVAEAARAIDAQAGRRLSDLRRQLAEQLLELRGLRGKSGRVHQMLKRVDHEGEEFERCTPHVAAMRAVQARLLRDTLQSLSSDKLRDDMAQMHKEISATLFNLGAKKAFVSLCARLRERIGRARARADETHQMLSAGYRQLNSDFGFALTVMAPPTLERYVADFDLIERSYVQYLGLSHALRLSEPRFMEQFRRMLLSKLRVAFENASGDVELWHKAVTVQIEGQLRDRRRDFKRRRDALERVSAASGELEQRIQELELQDKHQQQLMARAREMAAELNDAATEALETTGAPAREPPTLTLVIPGHTPRTVHAA